jgi:hypothetical protein
MSALVIRFWVQCGNDAPRSRAQIKVSTRYARRDLQKLPAGERARRESLGTDSLIFCSIPVRAQLLRNKSRNFFCLCRCRCCARRECKTERARAQSFVRATTTREYHRRRKSLLYGAFRDVGNLRARMQRAFASHVFVSRARMIIDVAMCVTSREYTFR